MDLKKISTKAQTFTFNNVIFFNKRILKLSRWHQAMQKSVIALFGRICFDRDVLLITVKRIRGDLDKSQYCNREYSQR